MRVDDVVAILRSLAGDSPDIEVKEFFNGKEIMFTFEGTRGNERKSAVRTPASRWYSVEVEELFDCTFVDEDADEHEIREYLRKCVAVAKAYVRHGGVRERRGLLRSRSIVIDVDGSTVRLQKIIGRRER